jgi:hypothetical protein
MTTPRAVQPSAAALAADPIGTPGTAKQPLWATAVLLPSIQTIIRIIAKASLRHCYIFRQKFPRKSALGWQVGVFRLFHRERHWQTPVVTAEALAIIAPATPVTVTASSRWPECSPVHGGPTGRPRDVPPPGLHREKVLGRVPPDAALA